MAEQRPKQTKRQAPPPYRRRQRALPSGTRSPAQKITRPTPPKTVHARTHPQPHQYVMPKYATRAIGRSPQSPLQKKLQTCKKSYGKNRKKHPHVSTHPHFRQCLIPSRLRPARQKTPHAALQKKLRPRPPPRTDFAAALPLPLIPYPRRQRVSSAATKARSILAPAAFGSFRSARPQKRRTVQPAARSSRLTFRSRAMLRSIFATQKARFPFRSACRCFQSYPCQNSPSQNTATRYPAKTTSGFPGSASTFLR